MATKTTKKVTKMNVTKMTPQELMTTFVQVPGLKPGTDPVQIAESDRDAIAAIESAGGKINTTTIGLPTLINETRKLVEGYEESKRKASIALGYIHQNELFKQCTRPDGKPYSNMETFASDVLPGLARSTVIGLYTAGSKIYLPALNGEFGSASEAIANQSPTNASVLKAALIAENTRNETCKAIVKATQGGKRLSKTVAQEIVKAVRGTGKRTGGATGTNTGNESTAVYDLLTSDHHISATRDHETSALYLTCNENGTKFRDILTQGVKDPAKAQAVCGALLKLIASAK